jgi:hypothetical protein
VSSLIYEEVPRGQDEIRWIRQVAAFYLDPMRSCLTRNSGVVYIYIIIYHDIYIYIYIYIYIS